MNLSAVLVEVCYSKNIYALYAYIKYSGASIREFFPTFVALYASLKIL